MNKPGNSAGREKRPAQKAATPAPDEKRVALLRRVRTVLAIATCLIDLPLLYLNVPYRLFAALSLLPPLVCIALYCIFPYDITLLRDEAHRRASYFILLLPACIAPTLGAFYLDMFRWQPLLLAYCICAALLFAALLLFTKEWRTRKRAAFLMLLAVLCYSFAAVAELNYLADTSVPVEHSAIVQEQYLNENWSARDHYRLNVRTEDGTLIPLAVSEAYYTEVSTGDKITVLIYPGALGIPYAEAAQP